MATRAAADRVSPDDARILALESASVLGHTMKLSVLAPGPPLDRDALRASVAARLSRVPRATQRVERVDGVAYWVPSEDFDIRDHVRTDQREVCASPEDLWRVIGRLMSERLDPSRPLWTFDVIGPLADGSEAVLARIHHAMADGLACVRFLDAVLWDAHPRCPACPRGGQRSGRPARCPPPPRMAGAMVRQLGHPGSRSPFDRPISGARELAFSVAPLAEVAAIGASRPRRATVNDVLLAVITGGLRDWLGIRPGHHEHLHAQIPVSLNRARDATALGNVDSFLNVGLPLGDPDPLSRLDRLRAETSRRKTAGDARELYDAFRAAERVPAVGRAVERLAASGREFSVAVSNVPGPRSPVAIAGRPLAHLFTSSEPGAHHALRISAISCAGELAVALCTDPSALPGVADLGLAVERAYAELRDAAL